MQSGSNPYLCDLGIRKLSEIVRNANANGCSLDSLEVIDEATRVKSERLAYGWIFLKEINSLDLAQKIADQTLYSPTRSWLNGVLDDLDSHIITEAEFNVTMHRQIVLHANFHHLCDIEKYSTLKYSSIIKEL